MFTPTPYFNVPGHNSPVSFNSSKKTIRDIFHHQAQFNGSFNESFSGHSVGHSVGCLVGRKSGSFILSFSDPFRGSEAKGGGDSHSFSMAATLDQEHHGCDTID